MKKTTKNTFAYQKNNIPSMRRRFAAILYDLMLCVACVFVFVALAVTLNQGESLNTQQRPFLTVGVLGVWLAYYLWFWRQGGQTPGMKVWKIRLVADTPPASMTKLLIRFAVVCLTLGLAIGLGFFRRDKKGLHDILSKTSMRLS